MTIRVKIDEFKYDVQFNADGECDGIFMITDVPHDSGPFEHETEDLTDILRTSIYWQIITAAEQEILERQVDAAISNHED